MAILDNFGGAVELELGPSPPKTNKNIQRNTSTNISKGIFYCF